MTNARRIFITGATGGLGRRLVADRLARGDSVLVLSRRPDEARRLFAAVANPRIEVIEGDPAIPGRWQRFVGGCDAVVHLAGEPIAGRRWNPEVRESIRRSRVEGTYQVAFAVRTSAKPPPVLLSASGIGILPRGDHGPLAESALPGRGFLSQVAIAWEREAMRARSEATRVVALRIPIVLDAESGFLREIVPWWRRGVDPTPWSSRDRVPWVHWKDLLRIVDRALVDDRLEGSVHAVAPEASEAASWRRAIARAIGRGALRVPAMLSRLVAGGVVDAMRGSCDARPAKLESIGFTWHHPDLQEAIAEELRPAVERTPASSPPQRPTPKPVVVRKPIDPAAASSSAPSVPSAALVSEAATRPERESPEAPRVPPPREALREAPIVAAALPKEPKPVVETPPAPTEPTGASASAESSPSPAVRTTAAAAVVCSVAAIAADDPREVESLARLIAAWRSVGVEVVLASREGVVSIERLIEALRFSGPLILDLGASLRSGSERRLLRATPLPPAIVVALLERLAGARGVRASLHGADGPIDPARLRGAVPLRLDLAGDAASLEQAIAAIAEPWWREGAIAIFRPSSEHASVVAGGVDKAVGLQRILRGLGLPPSRAFVVAGGEEDLGLLALCRGMVLGEASARLAAASSHLAPRGAWAEADAMVRRAFAAILSEQHAPVHSPIAPSAP